MKLDSWISNNYHQLITGVLGRRAVKQVTGDRDRMLAILPVMAERLVTELIASSDRSPLIGWRGGQQAFYQIDLRMKMLPEIVEMYATLLTEGLINRMMTRILNHRWFVIVTPVMFLIRIVSINWETEQYIVLPTERLTIRYLLHFQSSCNDSHMLAYSIYYIH